MGSIERQPVETELDVIVVGAGISGVNAAYRVQTELPNHSYAILEARSNLGGTWDLFRYPGIRSDSDLHTFGFAWRPWPGKNTIADGKAIRDYVLESAQQYGIDRKIRYNHSLRKADWSTRDQRWTLTVDVNGVEAIYHARFLIMGTGYYNYQEPLDASIPGLENFKGKIIHPQFWPEDYDYTNKKMVIIGSGATAITILPVVAEKVSQVTMLQRSPSYVIPQPQQDRLGKLAHWVLPKSWAFKLVRWKFLVLPYLFFQFCRNYPNAARRVIKRWTSPLMTPRVPHDPHFKPRYNPWEQRLCVCPDGDFYKALKQRENTNVVTDTIKTVTATGINTTNGTKIDADVIVTATGLKIQLAGGTHLSVDGVPFKVGDHFLWRGMMLQNLPNLAYIIGYTNASWTLGADATAIGACRIIKHMEKQGFTSAIARIPKGSTIDEQPVLNLNSTYVEKAKGQLPRAGSSGPWKPRTHYLSDLKSAQRGDLNEGMEYVRGPVKKVA